MKKLRQGNRLESGVIHYFEPKEGWGYIKTSARDLTFFDVSAFRGQMPSNPNRGLKVQFQLAPNKEGFSQATHVYLARVPKATDESKFSPKDKDASL